jgi:hypothetical protein
VAYTKTSRHFNKQGKAGIPRSLRAIEGVVHLRNRAR